MAEYPHFSTIEMKEAFPHSCRLIQKLHEHFRHARGPACSLVVRGAAATAGCQFESWVRREKSDNWRVIAGIKSLWPLPAIDQGT